MPASTLAYARTTKSAEEAIVCRAFCQPPPQHLCGCHGDKPMAMSQPRTCDWERSGAAPLAPQEFLSSTCEMREGQIAREMGRQKR